MATGKSLSLLCLSFPVFKMKVIIGLIYGLPPLAQWLRICLPMQEMGVQSLVWEDHLEKEMATHSNIPAWEIQWTELPGSLQSMGWQGVIHIGSFFGCVVCLFLFLF